MIPFGEQYLAHRIGDFLLQNGFLALNKKRWLSVAVLHGLVYSVPFLFLLAAVDHRDGWHKLLSWLLIVATHIWIDHWNIGSWWSKMYNWSWHEPPTTPLWVIVEIDQSLHYLINYVVLLM